MSWRASVAFLALGSLAACNLISGAADLTVCGAECETSSEPTPSRDSDAGSLVVEAGPDGALPPVCTEGQVACTGKTAATCVGGSWKTQTCDQSCVAGACQPFPSCRNASGDGCGNANTSCCTSAAVPAGTFVRGGNASTSATVSAFSLDVFEVTVGRFRAFVDSGGGTKASPPADGSGAHPKNPGSGWSAVWNAYLPADTAALRFALGGANAMWTTTAGANEHRPMNRASWLLAFAFCAWDGGRLPTAAEWDFAAAGGAEQRYYPWSVPASSTSIGASQAAYNCNFSPPAQSCVDVCNDGSACDVNCTVGCTTSCSGCKATSDIAPVGVLPAGAGKYAQLDLGGNLAEMTMDLAPPAPAINPCNDCVQFLTGDPKSAGAGSWGGGKGRNAEFVVFGGGWSSASTALRNASSSSIVYSAVDDAIGFRCARD